MKEVTLAVLFVVHWSVAIFMAFYVFFRKNRTYDWLYILISAGVMIQWAFLHECIISFFEKQLLIPGYKWGTNPSLHPSLVFYQLNTNVGGFIKNSIHVISILLLLYNIVYIGLDYKLSFISLAALCGFTLFASFQNLTPSAKEKCSITCSEHTLHR